MYDSPYDPKASLDEPAVLVTLPRQPTSMTAPSREPSCQPTASQDPMSGQYQVVLPSQPEVQDPQYHHKLGYGMYNQMAATSAASANGFTRLQPSVDRPSYPTYQMSTTSYQGYLPVQTYSMADGWKIDPTMTYAAPQYSYHLAHTQSRPDQCMPAAAHTLTTATNTNHHGLAIYDNSHRQYGPITHGLGPDSHPRATYLTDAPQKCSSGGTGYSSGIVNGSPMSTMSVSAPSHQSPVQSLAMSSTSPIPSTEVKKSSHKSARTKGCRTYDDSRKPGPGRAIQPERYWVAGVPWMHLELGTKVKQSFELRIDLDNADISEKDDAWKVRYAAYTSAQTGINGAKSKKGAGLPRGQSKHRIYEEASNENCWKLVALNDCLLNVSKGVLQRAQDSYRNVTPGKESRRQKRVNKLKDKAALQRARDGTAVVREQRPLPDSIPSSQHDLGFEQLSTMNASLHPQALRYPSKSVQSPTPGYISASDSSSTLSGPSTVPSTPHSGSYQPLGINHPQPSTHMWLDGVNYTSWQTCYDSKHDFMPLTDTSSYDSNFFE